MNYYANEELMGLLCSPVHDNKLLAVALLNSQYNIEEDRARLIVFNSMPELLGQTFIKVEQGDWNGQEELRFYTDESSGFRFTHWQDCCESVYIEDINGDLADLVGSPILQAEEVNDDGNEDDEHHESVTWTFYKFATKNGYVTVRWCGSSNGYYSESVDFCTFSDK